jgi:GNAT superfamily N-acetyltransferase
MYLYERFTNEDRSYTNICFKSENRLRGIVNTISGRQIHLFLSDDVIQTDLSEMNDYLFKKFPMVKSFFGDKEGIVKFFNNSRIKPRKTKDFIFMELEKEKYGREHSINRSSSLECVKPTLEMATGILPLLINYEVEELGADLGKINRSKVLVVLRGRIKRGELTALVDRGRPVAFAGVNARFKEVCQIGSVYVMPRYREKGYGSFIVKSHIERLFKNYSRIVLFVGTDNNRALHLYRNVGFNGTGELEQAFLPSLKLTNMSKVR